MTAFIPLFLRERAFAGTRYTTKNKRKSHFSGILVAVAFMTRWGALEHPTATGIFQGRDFPEAELSSGCHLSTFS